MDATPNHQAADVLAQRAFAAVIRDARRRPFGWGEHDCVLFAAAVARARTGRDALAELGLQPTWRTAQEAASAIEGVGGLRIALTRLFGEPVGVLAASAGDIVLTKDPDHIGRVLLAIANQGVLLAPAAAGLAALPISAGIEAWKLQ